MAPLPVQAPDVDRRSTTRVPPDPFPRIDTNEYSLDHARALRAGRRPAEPAIEVRPLQVYDALIA